MAQKKITGVKFIEPEQDICSCCGKIKNIANDFYPSNSDLYNGHLPICNRCLFEAFHRYLIHYHDAELAVKRMCMAFDIYWSADKFKFSKKKDTEMSQFDDYLKRIITFKRNNFDTSIDDGFEFDERKVIDDQEEEVSGKIFKAAVQRWGAGFTAEEYKTLDDHYNMLKKANPNCNDNQEIFIKDLCYTKMQQVGAIKDRNTDDFKKLTEAYQKLFQTTGLKTSQSVDAADADPVGVIIDMIEQYTPAEYYKSQEMYQDFNNFDDYRRRFIDRPVDNIINSTSIRDDEYFIGDDEDGEG